MTSRFLQVYEANADDVFFVDDLLENVESARSVGITAHLYRDPASLLAAVEGFGESAT